MSRLARLSWTAVVLGGWIIAAGGAVAADRTAEAILKDLESVEMPKLDASKEKRPGLYSRLPWQKRRNRSTNGPRSSSSCTRPPRTMSASPTLMIERWRMREPTGPKIDDILKEIEQVLTQTNDPKFKLEATFTKAQIKLSKSRSSGTPDLSAAEEFLKLAPKDPRGVSLLYRPPLTS